MAQTYGLMGNSGTTILAIWASSLELMAFGVFAPGKDGPEQLKEIADRYLAAWASGDEARIAALYHKDASFSDTMLGLQAHGASAIAELGEKRSSPGIGLV